MDSASTYGVANDPCDESDAPNNTRGNGSSSSSLEAKRPKILSTVGSTTAISRNQPNEDVDQFKASDIRDVDKKPEIVQRNKRLFGALMGHLGTAKRRLEEDSSHIDKQASRQNAVIQKNGMENRRLQLLQKEATEAERAKEKGLKEIFQLRQRKSEISASLAVWKEKCALPLAQVLMTQCLPRICWLPSAHNDRTKKMLESRPEEVATDIYEREASDADLLQQIDAELASLQSRVSINSYNNEPNSATTEKDIPKSGQPSESETGATDRMTSNELAEYMLRIQNRRALAHRTDNIRNNNDTDSSENRRNWGIEEPSYGEDMRDSGNRPGPVAYVSQSRREAEHGASDQGMRNMQHDSSYRNQHDGNQNYGNSTRGQNSFNQNEKSSYRGRESNSNSGRSREQSGHTDNRGNSRGAGEDGDDVRRLDNRNQSVPLSTKSVTPAAEPADEDDELEAGEEVESDEEEDEAELLLAALGGRKH